MTGSTQDKDMMTLAGKLEILERRVRVLEEWKQNREQLDIQYAQVELANTLWLHGREVIN